VSWLILFDPDEIFVLFAKKEFWRALNARAIGNQRSKRKRRFDFRMAFGLLYLTSELTLCDYSFRNRVAYAYRTNFSDSNYCHLKHLTA